MSKKRHEVTNDLIRDLILADEYLSDTDSAEGSIEPRPSPDICAPSISTQQIRPSLPPLILPGPVILSEDSDIDGVEDQAASEDDDNISNDDEEDSGDERLDEDDPEPLLDFFFRHWG